MKVFSNILKKHWLLPITLFITLFTTNVNALDNHYIVSHRSDSNSDYAVAVWTHNNVMESIYASVWDGSSWSAATQISDPNFNAINAVVSVNSNGDAVVVWAYFDGNMQLASRTLENGGSWSNIVTISGTFFEVLINKSNTLGTPTYSVSLNDVGDLFATWTWQNGPDVSVAAATGTFDATTAWSGLTTTQISP